MFYDIPYIYKINKFNRMNAVFKFRLYVSFRDISSNDAINGGDIIQFVLLTC